ncbi:hypothetical protein JWJ90_13300 [Desulfobulbus rhabdoformis]|jgi:hypothetical protein|uniref:hypothetical protein n=1 Tax=Desulfobulbus rhabdoformis TaxID=34032 RepID=UPI001964B003|nr:hypothetical protein [Desulfobulbus rhabdoformis]MBM9615256.1 hypothetical protein [Desulfobulbus rhabdoformis]
MINLGDAPEQKESTGGPIPPKSSVKVRIEVREPKKKDEQDPCVFIASTGLKQLDLEFEVIGGQFEGVRIWEYWSLPPSMQTINLTKGQEGACNGSFAKMRGAIEASRNLDPADPNANRDIQSWYDLNGLEIPVRVGIDKPKPGDLYINNKISKVLVPGDKEFELVMSGGEVITEEPIPSIPEGGANKGGGSGKNGGQQGAPGGTTTTQNGGQQSVKTPSWAKRK